MLQLSAFSRNSSYTFVLIVERKIYMYEEVCDNERLKTTLMFPIIRQRNVQ